MDTTCDWSATQYLIISPNVEPLIYYSHLGPMICALLLGGFVLFSDRSRLANIVLFFITIMFATWTYFDLILWASPTPQDVIFFWTAILPVELSIYAASLYLVYIFANGQKDISLTKKIFIALPFIPLLVFLPTHYAVSGLSPSCDEGAIEGPAIQYMYLFEFIYILWTAGVAASAVTKEKRSLERMQLLYLVLGIVFLLVVFSIGNITLIFNLDPVYEQYKLFGMPIFVALIAYGIVKFKTFNAKILAVQALVAALAIAVLSLLFLQTLANIRIVSAVTFMFVCILGNSLIRAVKREISQREQIQLLANDLEDANEQQVILIHFITHQIKGFVAKSRNIFSMALEGDFGPVGPELKPMLQAGFDSDTKGATVIQEILNAANIKSGKVTYTMEPFDVAPLIQDMVNYHNASASEKNVAVHVNLGDAPIRVLGDRAQLMNVFKNLIDNSIKYTLQGEVNISLTPEPEKKMVLFTIKDTGVGITPEDMANLFTEGGHGKDSVKVNVESTGFGLYIVKQIIDAHKGRVWAESEGAGKGSQFYIELPAA